MYTIIWYLIIQTLQQCLVVKNYLLILIYYLLGIIVGGIMNAALLNGIKGLITSSKSSMVLLVLVASFVALFTKHLASNDFAQIWYVVIPAWLPSHAATRWAPGTPDPSQPPPPPPTGLMGGTPPPPPGP